MEEKATKNSHYDKRLILEIVKQVEEGVPRKELKEKHGLGKKTLDAWMKQYGSQSYHENKRRDFTKLEKREIVAAIEQGMSISQACVIYRIRSSKSIREWVKQISTEKCSFTIPIKSGMAKDKKASKRNLKQEELEKALQEAQMKIVALNTLIDVAEEQLKINIRKKSGAKPSSE